MSLLCHVSHRVARPLTTLTWLMWLALWLAYAAGGTAGSLARDLVPLSWGLVVSSWLLLWLHGRTCPAKRAAAAAEDGGQVADDRAAWADGEVRFDAGTPARGQRAV